MRATVLYVVDHVLMGKTESNHLVAMDSPVASGGSGAAPTPVELLVQACAGCVSIDIINIMAKQRKTLERLEMEVDAVRAEHAPRVIRSLAYHCCADGPDLTSEDIQTALNLSLTKYCSVSLSLDRSVPFAVRMTVNGVESEEWIIDRQKT